MKIQAALFLLTLLVVHCAVAVPHHRFISFKRQQQESKQLVAGRGTEVQLCGVCIQFAGQAINTLLNIALDAGVLRTCAAICTIVEDKTGGNKVIGEVCDILCDIVGADEFMKLVEKADLDPIYLCELLKTCPIKDDGDATITSMTVTPKSGPQGQFKIDVQYVSKNGTGTGLAAIGVRTVDGVPVGDNELRTPMPAGSYDIYWTLNAVPDPDCDPTQGFCELWYPGNYTAVVELCNGECGSKHPHSQVYTRATASFTITEN